MEIAEFSQVFPKFARRLGVDNAALFIKLVREREVPAGTALVDHQIPVASLYLVLEGEFRVMVPSMDNELEIERIGPGKLIGEALLFSEDPLSTTRVMAVTPARMIEIPHAQYWSWWKDNPDLASVLTREIIDHMSERVRIADELINHSLHRQASHPAHPQN